MNFQENLVRARKARGLSQEELAARIGVSRQAVSKWETGDAMPDLSKLVALADALELRLDDLCGREAPPEPAAPPVPETPPAAPRRKRRAWLAPALCGFLLAALLAGGLWAWSRRNWEQAAWTSLPDTFTGSGVSFPRQLGGRDRNWTILGCSFTPSVSGGAWTYQITFTDSSGASTTCDAVCEGGVCTGQAQLTPYVTYTVTASIVDKSGNSRNALLATGMSFDEDSVRWWPAEE